MLHVWPFKRPFHMAFKTCRLKVDEGDRIRDLLPGRLHKTLYVSSYVLWCWNKAVACLKEGKCGTLEEKVIFVLRTLYDKIQFSYYVVLVNVLDSSSSL